ncbi:hypothetical protein niasHT_008545 [Heterodera trifolii]|uniref:Uncharacterized protein n=1 Tax=Heterodera trifolii TaxID=157864 RepID=A0ABD2M9W6_9BILA
MMLLPPMIFLALSLAFLLNNNGTFGGGCTSKDGVMVSNGQMKQEQLKKKRQGTTPKARDLSRRNSSTSTSIGSEIDINDTIKFIKETTRDGYTSPMRSARFSADSQMPFPPLSPHVTDFAGDKMQRASSIAKNGLASPMRSSRFSDSQMPFPPLSPNITHFAGDKSSRAFSIAKNGIASPLRPPPSPKFTHVAGDKASRISSPAKKSTEVKSESDFGKISAKKSTEVKSCAKKSTEVKSESDFGKISDKITIRQKKGQKYTTAANHPRLDQNGTSTVAEPKTTEQLQSEKLLWDPDFITIQLDTSAGSQTKHSCDEQFVDKKIDLPVKQIYKN